MDISGIQNVSAFAAQSLSSLKAVETGEEETQTQSSTGAAQVDTYTHLEAEESTGIYYPTSEGVEVDAPAQQVSAGGQAASSEDSDTDDVLEDLEEQRDELEAQIARTADEEEKEELQRELQEVERQISIYENQSLQDE